ncbi:nuclear transport factor 2 family protein [Mesorhizobium sp. YR577]|uniref:nuclear transport factor 2 family protein n=1 Tax=Mesorhizobium sp. YR577 TaxID=1884373 RepID=UPI0008DF9A8F|nr:nuclear transport factor 2 family protein [Mesorhizobium sp. YR577]SFU11293.1 SnoaL-like domain-containing protein [Mesorhizobium sp. YR577]
METTDAPLAENEIRKQLYRFFLALDERQFDTMTQIMTPDGLWRRAGIEIRGGGMLLEVMGKRGADRHTRHILSNMIIDMETAEAATARFYSTAWVYVGAPDEKGVCPIDIPSSIGVYTAKFARTEKGWQMADLRSKPAFKQQK